MEKINVFIVEDHHIVRSGLCAILGSDPKINVMGEDACPLNAITKLEGAQAPDVLLTDLHLPGMNGMTLAHRLKEIHPTIKVILLTMEDGITYMVQAWDMGIRGYLLKDAQNEELIYAVKHVASGGVFVCNAMTEKSLTLLAKKQPLLSPKDIEIELTKREIEILTLISEGYTNLEMADKLFTSRRTVEGHRQSLLTKTGTRNTGALIKFAMQYGLLLKE